MGLSTLSGHAVSRYSFGTMQFGEGADEHASATMYAACREAGINFFDTANVYTGGQSESILGRLVAWTARHAGVWGPIISAKSLEQLEPSLQAIEFDMDDALYARMAALSPAPAPDNDRLEEANV